MNLVNLNYLKSELRDLEHHFQSKNFNLVIQKSKKIIKNNPEQMPFYNYLGLAYRQIGKLYLAEDTFKKAHRINPNNLSVITNLASIYRHLEDFSNSIKYFEIGIKKNDKNVNILCNYANLKRDLNDISGSIELYKKAIKINNNLPIVLINLAGSYQTLGDFEKSKKYLKILLKKFPKMTKANKMLSDVTDYSKDDSHQKEMLKKINDTSYNEEDKISLYYALAKSYEDQKKFKESSNFTERGNRSTKNIIEKNGISIKNEIYHFNNIKKIFSDVNFNKITNKNDIGNNLIFVLGLPRSGTTLTHQILASHSEVYGAGELTLLSELIRKNIENKDFLNIFKNNSEKNDKKIIEITKKYNEKLSFFNTKKKIIVDKSPLNFILIGFIKILFPNAKIIHCTRNLKDTALSIYKNVFDGFALPWSYNQKDIVKFISLYLDLMKFWKTKMPDFIYELNYENLVNDQENQSKKLLKFCKIPWEQDVLNFYNKKTPIKTASITQAREPIYKSSVNTSKKYYKYLNFFSELELLDK